MVGPLTQNLADAAGSGMHDDRVARLHCVGFPAEKTRRHAFQQDRGGGREIDVIGHVHELAGRAQHEFGVGADRLQIRDAIAGPETADVSADGLDHAGAFIAGNERQWRWIKTAALIGIEKIDADRVIAHEHFAGRRSRFFDFRPLHDVRSTIVLDSNHVRHICIPRYWLVSAGL